MQYTPLPDYSYESYAPGFLRSDPALFFAVLLAVLYELRPRRPKTSKKFWRNSFCVQPVSDNWLRVGRLIPPWLHFWSTEKSKNEISVHKNEKMSQKVVIFRENSKITRPPKWCHHWTQMKKPYGANSETPWFKTSRIRFRHWFLPKCRPSCSKTHFEKNGRQFFENILQVAGTFLFLLTSRTSVRALSVT